jgi:hypothetical protein
MGSNRTATDEQKRQIITVAKETEITLNGFPAEFTASNQTINVFDVDTFEMITLDYLDFERGLLVDNGKFKTKK